MTTLKIYHNPRCSKSRETLALLNENASDVEIINYLDTPPSPDELKDILNRLGIGPRDLLRRKEALYKSLNLDDPTLSDQQLTDIMSQNPKLIERPIVIHGTKAAIGRPPENVLEIL
ncbi:arsenate reductase [Methylophaga lonarensis MPL]|uniref:Arsenate reductase n=1 Tax=Methylophaga lonarensis MPL TaxID=1286106 RepID=M7P0Q2_9GAMM|nr:arsenate reductase (glutaredoxin) [Methylophaga lonarensis]EMR13057.1 arsenate reductase [Methylophaga lonarensis MPL]